MPYALNATITIHARGPGLYPTPMGVWSIRDGVGYVDAHPCQDIDAAITTMLAKAGDTHPIHAIPADTREWRLTIDHAHIPLPWGGYEDCSVHPNPSPWMTTPTETALRAQLARAVEDHNQRVHSAGVYMDRIHTIALCNAQLHERPLGDRALSATIHPGATLPFIGATADISAEMAQAIQYYTPTSPALERTLYSYVHHTHHQAYASIPLRISLLPGGSLPDGHHIVAAYRPHYDGNAPLMVLALARTMPPDDTFVDDTINTPYPKDRRHWVIVKILTPHTVGCIHGLTNYTPPKAMTQHARMDWCRHAGSSAYIAPCIDAYHGLRQAINRWPVQFQASPMI